MAKSKFTKIDTDIKSELLGRLLVELCSGVSPTRKEVADGCSASLVTVGKAAKALTKSRLMIERKYSSDSSRPRSHISFSDELKILVIDLSSSIFTMKVCTVSGESSFTNRYIYCHQFSFEDNLNTFLSRLGMRALLSGETFSAVTVICPDRGEDGIPALFDREAVRIALFSLFNNGIVNFMTVSESVAAAVGFNVVGNTLREGVSYIFLGYHISSFYISPSKEVIICHNEKLIIDSKSSVKALIRSRPSKNEFDALLAALVNHMDSAFSAPLVIIESDICKPDEVTMRRISKLFAYAGVMPPMIKNSLDAPSLSLLGALRQTAFEITSKYIIASDALDPKIIKSN